MLGGRFVGANILGEGIPCAAFGAFSVPFRGFVATFGADIDGFQLSHFLFFPFRKIFCGAFGNYESEFVLIVFIGEHGGVAAVGYKAAFGEHGGLFGVIKNINIIRGRFDYAAVFRLKLPADIVLQGLSEQYAFPIPNAVEHLSAVSISAEKVLVN